MSNAGKPPAGHRPFELWNRSGNRLAAGLLRSPLHPLASGRLTLVTVTGRRSGRLYTLPVSYTAEQGRLRIPVMWPGRKTWWRNLRCGAAVSLRLRGVERTGQARAVEGPGGDVTVEVVLDRPPAG